MIGQIAVEPEHRSIGNGRLQGGYFPACVPLVDGHIRRHLCGGNIVSMKIVHRINRIFGNILPLADNGAPCAQKIPFGLACCGDVGMDELGFASALKPDPDALLVSIGDIMPHPLVSGSGHRFNGFAEQADNPVDVVTAPIVTGPPGDGSIR